MSIYKEYHKLENGQEVKMSITFNKDSYNWATGQQKEKGYQVTVVPIERSEDGKWESFKAFSGFNDLLLAVDRQSSKRLTTAISILADRKEKYLAHIKNNNF